MVMGTGQAARGQFVELVPDARVVFTWGWIDMPDVPPGSTTVQIDLEPEGDGTLIRLTHSDLPVDRTNLHRRGWEHYLTRLATRAGATPGRTPAQGEERARGKKGVDPHAA